MPLVTRRLPLFCVSAALLSIIWCSAHSETAENVVFSPNHRIAVTFELSKTGEPAYRVAFDGKPVLQNSRLGLVRDDADFSKELHVVSIEPTRQVSDRYEILTAKRRQNSYEANRSEVRLATASGKRLDVIFQVSNDGFAYRYYFPDTQAEPHRLLREVSSFHFSTGAHAWLQPLAVSKVGWMRANPSYEEYYQKEIPVGTPSPTTAGWIYPALFRTGDVWVIVSEGSLPRNYCGSHLRADSPDGEYFVEYADEKDVEDDGPSHPVSTLPWLTPWRLAAIGDLQTVTESMLGVDLAEPANGRLAKAHPGKASWSWPLLKDDKTVFDVQKQFIDYAAEMHWGYCLVDALWDTQIGYEKIKELADYGKTKGVQLLLWYNSNGTANDAPQTPKNRMSTHESRIAEFEKLKAMGIAGLKIDFFGGDGQSVIDYYRDILDDAEPYGFALNFHGTTLPRGWQRTYPNLMTMEAIRGLEYVTFEQANADQEPTHAVMLPFTRNVFDPMDFTPMVLDRIDNIERRTTSAFELALSVLFTSGVQHYAEIPEGMRKAPDYVRDFVKGLPVVWDDVRFVDGYPGKYVVMARFGGGRWYVSGINGEKESRTVVLDLKRLGQVKKGQLIGDGAEGALHFRKDPVRLGDDQKYTVTLPPCGGFVIEFEPAK